MTSICEGWLLWGGLFAFKVHHLLAPRRNRNGHNIESKFSITLVLLDISIGGCHQILSFFIIHGHLWLHRCPAPSGFHFHKHPFFSLFTHQINFISACTPISFLDVKTLHPKPIRSHLFPITTHLLGDGLISPLLHSSKFQHGHQYRKAQLGFWLNLQNVILPVAFIAKSILRSNVGLSAQFVSRYAESKSSQGKYIALTSHHDRASTRIHVWEKRRS